jgi:acetyl-CoA carboxylase biotin carboxylase subunit
MPIQCQVRLADESVCIGPPSSAESYLNIPAILSAVAITGADAVHPGVGFLSENADFAEIVAAHGLTFIGPEPRHIRAMGDKVEAKITAADAGLPLVPGSPGAVHTLAEAQRIGAGCWLSTFGQGRFGWRGTRHESGRNR